MEAIHCYLQKESFHFQCMCKNIEITLYETGIQKFYWIYINFKGKQSKSQFYVNNYWSQSNKKLLYRSQILLHLKRGYNQKKNHYFKSSREEIQSRKFQVMVQVIWEKNSESKSDEFLVQVVLSFIKESILSKMAIICSLRSKYL